MEEILNCIVAVYSWHVGKSHTRDDVVNVEVEDDPAVGMRYVEFQIGNHVTHTIVKKDSLSIDILTNDADEIWTITVKREQIA
jgi:hypothetical protein